LGNHGASLLIFQLARFGPTTPKRATTSSAASVDPTEARNRFFLACAQAQ